MTRDTRLPAGHSLDDQRLDETQTGARTTVVLIDARRPEASMPDAGPDAVATWLGLAPDARGLVGWDVLDAILAPGDMMLLTTWRDRGAAAAFERAALVPPDARIRCVRIVRDYGMFDRREAPQYYPDVRRG